MKFLLLIAVWTAIPLLVLILVEQILLRRQIMDWLSCEEYNDLEGQLPGSIHIEGPGCWCEPDLIFETEDGRQVWMHKGPGEELPAAKVIAQAVYDALIGK